MHFAYLYIQIITNHTYIFSKDAITFHICIILVQHLVKFVTSTFPNFYMKWIVELRWHISYFVDLIFKYCLYFSKHIPVRKRILFTFDIHWPGNLLWCLNGVKRWTPAMRSLLHLLQFSLYAASVFLWPLSQFTLFAGFCLSLIWPTLYKHCKLVAWSLPHKDVA